MDPGQNTTRGEMLSLLKKRGELSVADLARALGISPMGVRQHLSILERDGMIVSQKRRGATGRPGYVYSLSEKADESFPRNYDTLAQILLQSAEELYGLGAADALFRRRMEKLSANLAPRLKAGSPAERLKEIASAQGALGYMAEFEHGADGPMLREHNCAIAKIAQSYPQACRYELELFRQLVDESLVRRHCMAEGDPYCEYGLAGGTAGAADSEKPEPEPKPK